MILLEATAHLQIVNGAGAGTIQELSKPKLVLGRHPECDISFDNLDVSRHHAQILRIEDEFFLEDLHSTNGTFLNDQPVRKRRKIAEGDRIRISDVIFEFHHGVLPQPPPITSLAPQVSARDEAGDEKHAVLSRREVPLEKIAAGSQNAPLHERNSRQPSIEAERDFADRLLQRMLPSQVPELPGYQFYQYYCPAAYAGGGFYDYVSAYDGRLAVFMADITGRGAAAAMLIASLAREIRSSLLISSTPSDMLRNLNQTLLRYLPPDQFIKLVAAELVPATGEVTVVNAGHQRPLLRCPDGNARQLGGDQTGLPLGIDAEADYPQSRCCLPPGGTLIFYNDGLGQATAPSGSPYGHERVRSRAATTPGGAAEIGQHLVDDVRQFIGAAEQRDDICIVCVGRKEAGGAGNAKPIAFGHWLSEDRAQP